MRRITVVALVMTALTVLAMVAGIWWGQSLIYLFGAGLFALITAAVWWIWLARTWDRQLDAHQSSKLPRFLP